MNQTRLTRPLAAVLVILAVSSLASCGGKTQKHISVIVREPGSGTREAFDRTVTDGTHYLEEAANGSKVYHTTKSADIQRETGNVITKVASDKNAIGYLSLASVNDSCKVVAVDGVLPSEQAVRDGSYPISRPFMIMTKRGLALTPRTADFLRFLQSTDASAPAQSAGCIFLQDTAARGGVAVTPFEPLQRLPDGERIVLSGSTSVEKFIRAAAVAYADLYGANASDLFTIDLHGSSVGRRAVQDDTVGNVIGLSSTTVADPAIDAFPVCLDAVAVIVHPENERVNSLTLRELYGIFSGNIKTFADLVDAS